MHHRVDARLLREHEVSSEGFLEVHRPWHSPYPARWSVYGSVESKAESLRGPAPGPLGGYDHGQLSAGDSALKHAIPCRQWRSRDRLRRGRPDLHIAGSRRRRAVRSCGPRRNQRPPREMHTEHVTPVTRLTNGPLRLAGLPVRRSICSVQTRCAERVRRSRLSHHRRRASTPRCASQTRRSRWQNKPGPTRHPAHTFALHCGAVGTHHGRRPPSAWGNSSHESPGRHGLTLPQPLFAGAAAVDAVTVRQAASRAPAAPQTPCGRPPDHKPLPVAAHRPRRPQRCTLKQRGLEVSNARSSATAVLAWQPRLAACRHASP